MDGLIRISDKIRPNSPGGENVKWLEAIERFAGVHIGNGLSAGAQSDFDEKIDKNISDWVGTYKHLHENPELSTQEKETSALIADFSLFALEDPRPPITIFWLGAVDPLKWKQAQDTGTRLPSLHSSEFAPCQNRRYVRV